MNANPWSAMLYTKDGYRRDSMDRFGDDMCELILSYLIFADKVRLECVSKQWKRCVFHRQFEIFILGIDVDDTKNSLNRLIKVIDNKRELNEQYLETVLKKCSNISIVDIRIEVKSEVLSLIGQYCPNMRSLTFYSNGVQDFDFFCMYGYQLEELNLCVQNKEIKQLLKFCPNLKKSNICDTSVLLDEDTEYLSKLEQITNIVWIRTAGVNKMKIFGDKYNKTMKTLKIWFYDQTVEELKTCLSCISRLEELRELELNITVRQIKEPIDDCLSLIGQKCTKLLKLNLYIYFFAPISEQFFEVFQYFKAIKKLKLQINSSHNTVLSGSVECFKHCEQLKHLDITYQELTEHFFINIKTFVPQLKFLKIFTEKLFSKSFIVFFLPMNSIQRIVLTVKDRPNDKIYERFWYFGHCLSQWSYIIRRNIIRVNENCGLVSYEI